MWLVLHSQHLFSCGQRGPQEMAGYTRLRSGHTRLEEPQLKEVNTQAHGQKILLGVLFEGNVDLLLQPTSPGAVKELIWCMHIAHIHEGL